jgi:hypothetical protein
LEPTCHRGELEHQFSQVLFKRKGNELKDMKNYYDFDKKNYVPLMKNYIPRRGVTMDKSIRFYKYGQIELQ